MRRYKIRDSKTQSEQEHSLLGLTQSVEVGDMELDEIAELEVGMKYNLGRTDIERIE